MDTVLVTGSSDGIGLVAARELAGTGRRVLVHARSAERGAAALDQVRARGEAELVTGDLADLGQVRALADQVTAAAGDGLAGLVHNAGVWVRGGTPPVTGDGFETTLGVNVLAAHLLTRLLADRLTRSARLVWLGSGMAGSGRIDPASIGPGGPADDPGRAYADSKAADVALALAWQRRLPAGVVSAAVDPGWVRTKLASAGAPGRVEDGADTVVWCLTTAGLRPGYYRRRRPTPVPAGPADQDLQDALFAACDRAVGA